MRLQILLPYLLVATVASAHCLRSETPVPRTRDQIAIVKMDMIDRALTVVVFGTSLGKRAEWTKGLRDELADCLGTDVDLTIHARGGANSTDGLSSISDLGRNLPDVALIEYAMNDADIVDGVSLHTSIINHRRMIAALRTDRRDVAVVLIATNPVRGLQNLKRPRLKEYYAALADLAGQEEVSFFDGTARWTKRDLVKTGLPDGIHPDPAVEANIYVPSVTKLVLATLARKCD